MPIGAIAAVAAPYIASTLPEIYKTVSGIRQRNKAKKIEEKTVRPKYQIPDAVGEDVNNARAAYYDPRLPNQAAMEGLIGANQANYIRAAREAGQTPAQIFAAVNAANQQANEANLRLGIEGSNRQLQEQSLLSNALRGLAQQQNAQFEYDQAQPYDQAMRAAGALRQAANTNVYSGIKGITSTGLAAAGQKFPLKERGAYGAAMNMLGVKSRGGRYGESDGSHAPLFDPIDDDPSLFLDK